MAIKTHQSQIQVAAPAAGRALQPSPVGSQLAQFGNAIDEARVRAAAVRQDADLSRARLDHARAVGEIEDGMANDTEYLTRTDRFNAATGEAASEIAGRFPEGSRAREQFQIWSGGRLLEGERRARGRALTQEGQTRIADLTNGLQDISNRAISAGSDSERLALEADGEAAINDMVRGGWIDPERGSGLVASLRRDSAVGFANAMIDEDPGAAAAWLSGEFSGASDHVRREIASAGSRHGVDPDLLARIARVESNFNPDANAETSSAHGLFQFIGETAKAYDIGPHSSVEAQADAGARLTRDNIGVLTANLGRAPSDGEIYLAHFLGAGRAAQVIDARPDSAVASIVGVAAVRANRSILQGQTTADVRRWAEDKMAGNSGAAPAGLNADDMRILRARARDRIAAVNNELDADAVRSARQFATGQTQAWSMVGNGVLPSSQVISDLRDAAPSAAARTNIDTLSRTVEMVRVIRSSGTSTGQTILANLETLAARGSTPALEQQIRAVRSALDGHVKLLDDDPVTAANRAGLDIPALDFSNPSTSFAARRVAMQQVSARFGTPFRAFSLPETAELAGRLAGADPGDRLKMLALIVDGFGPDAPDVMAQLSQSSPVAAHAGGLMLNGPAGEAAARDAMRGLELLADRPANSELKGNFETIERTFLNGALAPELVQEQRNIAATARAIYAAMAENAGKADFDGDMYKAAIRRSIDTEIVPVNGVQTMIPRNVPAHIFEHAFSQIDDDALTQFSVGGGAPIDGNGSVIGGDLVKDMWLVAFEDGQYRISMSNPTDAAKYLLDSETGEYYRIDLNPAIAGRLYQVAASDPGRVIVGAGSGEAQTP